MPVIDLKNVSVFFEDGYSEAGAVNNASGYPINTATIVVDAIVGVVPVGARVSIGNFSEYVVLSTVETTGNTTSITLSPGLQAAVVDNAVVTIFGRFLEAVLGDGNVTFSESKTREFKLNRGRLYQVRNGDEVPMDVSFQFLYEELRASTGEPPTPVEVLKKTGAAASWLSSYTEDPCAPYCVNIRFVHHPPDCAGFQKEQVILPYFFYEKLDYDLKAGTISVSGKCNATDAAVLRLPA